LGGKTAEVAAGPVAVPRGCTTGARCPRELRWRSSAVGWSARVSRFHLTEADVRDVVPVAARVWKALTGRATPPLCW